MAHGESGSHGKESKERGGAKHGKWMEYAGRGLVAAGLTYGIAKFGSSILQAAAVSLAPHMLLLGAAAGLWYLFKPKKGGEKKAAHGGHH